MEKDIVFTKNNKNTDFLMLHGLTDEEIQIVNNSHNTLV